MRQVVLRRWAYCAATAISVFAIQGATPAADYYLANKPGSGSGTKDDPFGLADLPKPDNKPTRPDEVTMRTCFTALCLLLAWGVTGADPTLPSSSQWRFLPLITDGKIDAAWVQVGWGSFVVDGRSLRTECDERGMGLLFYEPEKFGDCQIRVVYRCEKPKSNAGIFVRIDDGIVAKIGEKSPEVHRDANGKLSPQMIDKLKEASEKHLGGWYPVHHGYEVQILDASDPLHRTGAIYSLAKAAPVPESPQADWRTMIITLDGERFTVDVDGKRLSSFDPRAADNPPRKNWTEPIRDLKRPTHGYIGLQNHDPGDVVWFREVSVRPLGSTE